MKYQLKLREREIIGTATTLYETLATSTLKNLEALSLPTMAVSVAIGNIEMIRERLGTTSDVSEDVELQNDLRMTVKDSLLYMESKVEKVKKDQLKLTIGTTDTEATAEEISELVAGFSEQMAFA